MSVPLSRAPALVLVVAAASASAAQAQDPCPSASGPEAEAGWNAYSANDMAGARLRFESALATCDNDQYARTGLGYVHLRAGDEVAARAAWAVVLAAEPYNVDALVGMGLADWRAGDLVAVREHFTTVLSLSPDHPTATEYLARVERAIGSAPRGDPAEEAWVAGDSRTAMAIYRRRLDADPNDGTALLRVALMTAWDEEYDEALTMLDRLVALQPSHLDARLARARVRAWSGDLGSAMDEAMAVLAERPDDPEALEAVALFQSWAGRHDEALESYDALLAIAPTSGAAQRHQAQALAWAADFEASRAAYDALLQRDPGDVEARLGLARTLAFSRRFDESVTEYDRVLEARPDEGRARTGKAKTLGWAGRLIESERVAVEAVRRDEGSAEAWGALGRAYQLQGRLAAAKDALDVATRLSPTLAEVRDQLRSVELGLAPRAAPTAVYESDSDGNRMLTTTLVARWRPVPRLEVRADGFQKRAEQVFDVGSVVRTVRGGMVTGRYQLRPGWTLTGGVGGSVSDATGEATFLSYRAGLSSPERHRFVAALDVVSGGLYETAALAERGVETTDLLFTGRWTPAGLWRIDASAGWSAYEGRDTNHRRGGHLAATRRFGSGASVGASFRGFSFERDLADGYFDPDFYGVWEVTGSWLARGGAWTLLSEAAPGVEIVGSDGDPAASIRARGRLAYGFAPGREVSLSVGYSTAGLAAFASGDSGYDYVAVVLGSNWVF